MRDTVHGTQMSYENYVVEEEDGDDDDNDGDSELELARFLILFAPFLVLCSTFFVSLRPSP